MFGDEKCRFFIRKIENTREGERRGGEEQWEDVRMLMRGCAHAQNRPRSTWIDELRTYVDLTTRAKIRRPALYSCSIFV